MVTKSNKKFDWTKAMVLFFAIMLSVGIAVALYAAKELFGVQISWPLFVVVSLNGLPATLYYFRYIREQKNWKMYTFFLVCFLFAQGIMVVGSFSKKYFLDHTSIYVAFEDAMLSLLYIKAILLGTVILPPILASLGKLAGLVFAMSLAVLWLAQCIVTALLFAIITPTITAAVFNWLTDHIGIDVDLPFAIND